jgi:hypothetical protein
MRIRYIIILSVAVVLTALCLMPSDNPIKAADGGTETYCPLIPIYKVTDYNTIEIYPHKKTTKGIQLFIFGISVYDGRYTVEGIHRRGSYDYQHIRVTK